jgi:hypothetical protein
MQGSVTTPALDTVLREVLQSLLRELVQGPQGAPGTS